MNSPSRKIRLDQYTSIEVKHLLKDLNNKWGVILPVGCTEQHGPYLPIGCDTDIARKAAENLALNLLEKDGYRALVLPDFSYTPSPGAEWTTGTVSVGFDFLGTGLSEVIKGALRTKWEFIVIVNAHGHNHGRCIEASMAGGSGAFGKQIPIIVVNIYDFISNIEHFGLNCGSHGGEFEISLYHYYYKEYKFNDFTINDDVISIKPPNIFGLDIEKRSFNGIISTKPPNLKRSLEKSNKIGKIIDKNLIETVIGNLDIYYESW